MTKENVAIFNYNEHCMVTNGNNIVLFPRSDKLIISYSIFGFKIR